MEKIFYCPDCSSKLDRMYGCGSESYFCDQCKKLVSREKIVPEKELISKIVKLVIEKLE